MQIGIVPGDTQTGLGAMAGTVYANYIYLMGGLTPNQTDIKTTRYAKIDNSNNIVDASTGLSSGSWTESPNLTFFGRRRGAGFGYNGFLYVVGGFDGSSGGGGVLADIEFAKINVSDGSIGTWSVSSVNINERWGLGMAVSNSYAYVIGGCINGAAPTCSAGGQTNSIQQFQVYNNDSGAVAGYSSSSTCSGANTGPCPGASGVDRTGGSSAVRNGYIYYAGGCTNIGCTTLTKATYYAPLDAYGTVGAWSTGGTMPGGGGVAWGKLVNAGNTLYYVGGQTGSANTTAQATVYYTSSFSSGSPTWGTASNGLPAARTQVGAAVWNNRIYVLGGYSTGGTVQTSVYSSPQQTSGGNITSSWSSSSTAFNVARAGATVVTYANNIYLIGGNDGTNYLSDVQFSQLNTSTGLAGSWTYSTSLPNAVSDADGFAANGYIYVVGGRSAATTCRPVTLFAPISANTTIATGNNPTGVGVWSETNQKYTGDRFGAAATYTQGRLYLIGGGCSSFVGSSDRMYSSTLKAQPQFASYSRLIDTDTDVFPTKWLMNGLDNSIGARWQASYESAFDATNVALHANFDDGTNNTNINEVAVGLDDCFGVATGTNQYSNAQYISPGYSMRVNVASGSGGGACDDDYANTTVRYDRFYVYFNTLPTTNTTIWNMTNSTAGSTLASFRYNSGTGKLQLRNSTTAEWTSSASVVAGTWIRVELGLTGNKVYARLYFGDAAHNFNQNGDVANESGNTNTLTVTDPANQSTIGMLINNPSPLTIYFDEFKASSNNWVGSAYPQWGQMTNFGDVTLGTANTFTPKDSAGSNTSYARWYYFLTSIDASQTFGYPEDVTRGPTIADLSLFFTADPSKRLRHGKTFTGGELQPYDTPF
jgi:hypothetical protein